MFYNVLINSDNSRPIGYCRVMLAFHLVWPNLFGRSGVPRVVKSQMATRLSRARGLGLSVTWPVTPVRDWDDDHSLSVSTRAPFLKVQKFSKELRLGDLFTSLATGSSLMPP